MFNIFISVWQLFKKIFTPTRILSKFGVFLSDTSPNPEYFGRTELGVETLLGGKNGFLIQGSECVKRVN